MDIRRRMLFKKNASSGGGGESTIGGSYTVNLNSQWEATTAVTNPNSALYDGVYRSSSNYNVNSGVAIMYITIKDCSSFKMYIRSYAESNYDYVMVSQLDKTINGSTAYGDTTLVKAHTRGNQQSGTALSNYTLVEFTGITAGEHTITVVYRKDSSVNNGDDRGYVLIEKIQEGSGDNEDSGDDVTLGSKACKAGDIAYTDSSGNYIVLDQDKYAPSGYTPIGVVVVPYGFAPDGKTRIISLNWASSSGTSSTSASMIVWGIYGTDTTLTNHNRVPTTDNAGSTTTGSNSGSYLPSDKFTGTVSYVDPLTQYSGTSRTMIPSPYLGDKPNPAYYAPISGYNNALVDFNGKGNTDVLVALGADYVAANAARNYKAAGAEEIEWYLPSMGELGFMLPRFNKIQAALTKVNAPQLGGSYFYWSSTEYSSRDAYCVNTNNGGVNYGGKDGGYYVRPFAILENYNTININNYLTIEALEDGLTASLSENSCEYCVDGDGNWKSLAAGTATESINSGHTLSFRGELTPASYIGIGTFTISKKYNLKGNCMSMLFGDNAANNYSLSGKDYAFYRLFYNCKNVVNVSSNFLPAIRLAKRCYSFMFYSCDSLTTAPELPATTVANYCCSSMFQHCTSLITAPTVLPAVKLVDDCYYEMFLGCTSLTTTPALPATTLANYCYYEMFVDCIRLTAAPELPATTLVNYCYTSMFKRCTKLNYIKMLATDISAMYCLRDWVTDVASTGTFVKNPAMTTLPTGVSGIPAGWTVQNATS